MHFVERPKDSQLNSAGVPPAFFIQKSQAGSLRYFVFSARTRKIGIVRAVADFGDGAAVKNVAEKTVAVAGHGDQFTFFGFGHFHNFRRRIAQRQFRLNGEAFLAQMRRRPFPDISRSVFISSDSASLQTG